MEKIFTLLLIFLLALGLMVSYLFLTKQIMAGSQKIVVGQKQIEQGEHMLAQGKARLSSGKRELSHAMTKYNETTTTSYLLVAALPVAGGVIALANRNIVGSKIAAGGQQVAKGQNKIKVGEEQLNAGKLALRYGITRLSQVNRIRFACAIGAIFFGSLLVTLGFCWRRSLIKLLKRTKL